MFEKPRFGFKYNVESRLHSFKYNFQWASWVTYIDGWIPKFSLFFPIVGYLIIFNDSISSYIAFENLANDQKMSTGLSSQTRLHSIYFALLFLGVSNLIYRFKRPRIFKYTTDVFSYVEFAMEKFVLSDFIRIHERIRHEGHVSISGKYYDSEWEGFLNSSRNTGEGTSKVISDGNWDDSKSQYGNLLRSMLRDDFYYLNRFKRSYLTLCITVSTLGYILLLVPSVDLFLKVMLAILFQS